MSPDIPAYVNKAAARAGKDDVALNLSYSTEDEDPVLIAGLIMSRSFAMELVRLLNEALK